MGWLQEAALIQAESLGSVTPLVQGPSAASRRAPSPRGVFQGESGEKGQRVGSLNDAEADADADADAGAGT
jgi:hypothetical protein